MYYALFIATSCQPKAILFTTNRHYLWLFPYLQLKHAYSSSMSCGWDFYQNESK